MSDEELRELIDELLADPDEQAARTHICEVIADALARVGRVLWITGYVLGPERAAGESPFGFGKDDTVGLAAVAQMGGELGQGAIDLLQSDNLYAASCLVRQIVEIEYLAAAFAEQDRIAAEWLRADGFQRRKFWSADKLRRRSEGRFLARDYWEHCDRGGHPTREGLVLLPDHKQLPPGLLWVDLAGHLNGSWRSVTKAVEVRRTDVPDEAMDGFSLVATAIDEWLMADRLYLALQNLGDELRSGAE